MTANGFFSLSLTLKGNTNITSLDLRRNKIGLKGISTLASVLKSFTCNIQYLDLDSTGMDDRCFVVLAQALSQRFTRSRLPPAVALAAAEEDVAAAAARDLRRRRGGALQRRRGGGRDPAAIIH